MSVNPEEIAAAALAAGEEAPLFDSTMKKKKKVTLDVDAELGLSSATPAAEGDDENGAGAGADGKTADEELAEMFGSMKKKKKSASKKTQFAVDLDNLPKPRTSQMTAAEEKKQAAAELIAEVDAAKVKEESEAAQTAPQQENGEKNGDLDFGELKKKKKSSSKGSKKLADFEKELAEAEAAAAGEESDEDGAEDGEGIAEDGVDHTAEGDLGDDVFAQDGGAEGADGVAGSRADDASKGDEAAAWLGSDRDYQYAELLGRIFKTLRQHNPALSGDKKKYTIVPPSVQREGSKKTLFANSLDICKRMHREPEHVYSFLFAELGTIGNVDGNQRLIIKGRFQPKQIENVLRKYIVEYVTCKTCKSPNTILSKKDRIYFMTCSTCGSTRSVSAIKTGFQAITGKRSKLRPK